MKSRTYSVVFCRNYNGLLLGRVTFGFSFFLFKITNGPMKLNEFLACGDNITETGRASATQGTCSGESCTGTVVRAVHMFTEVQNLSAFNLPSSSTDLLRRISSVQASSSTFQRILLTKSETKKMYKSLIQQQSSSSSSNLFFFLFTQFAVSLHAPNSRHHLLRLVMSGMPHAQEKPGSSPPLLYFAKHAATRLCGLNHRRRRHGVADFIASQTADACTEMSA